MEQGFDRPEKGERHKACGDYRNDKMGPSNAAIGHVNHHFVSCACASKTALWMLEAWTTWMCPR